MNVDQIIAKVFAGKATQEELAALKTWKTEAEENIAAIKEMQTINAVVSELPDYEDFDVDTAWASMSAQINADSSSTEPTAPADTVQTTKVRKMSWYQAVAAACIVMLVAVVGWQQLSGNDNSADEVYTATDQQLDTTLEDGTAVVLDKGGELTSLGHRAVRLRGRGYFEVEKAASDQFTIDLPEGKVTVLGTKFTIDAQQGKTTVFVSEGSVRFDHNSRKVLLQKGDLLTLSNGEIIKVKSDGQEAEFWRAHKLTFRNKMLQPVISTLNTVYGRDIIIDDLKAVAKCKVNTTFDNETIEEILAELKQTLGLKFHLIDDKIHIVSANC